MDEQRHLLFVNQFLPSNEQKLIDRLRDGATRRVTRPPEVTTALSNVPIDSIQDIVVGPNYVGILRTDGSISRFPYVATSRPLAPSASPAKNAAAPAAVPPPAGGSAGGSGAPVGGPGTSSGSGGGPPGGASMIARTAKFRRYESLSRVMLATSAASGRGGGRDHRSVIIDRARPMLPASSVPEDLIAQAQVVLQGKSREVIIRELQRTNLNVNEAVNNLLSRDDDDDDGSEGAEMCIPEELLTLLDSSHGAVLDSELYGGSESFEYLMSNRDRSRGNKDKDKSKSTKPVIESNSDTEALRRYEIPTGSIAEPWEGSNNDCKEAVFRAPRHFTHIACTQSEILAISEGKIYGWKWTESAGGSVPHPIYEKLGLEEGESIDRITACSLRVAVLTSSGRIATWLDTVACGERLSEALFVPPQKITTPDLVEQLVVSNQIAVARCANNVFYWCGLYPVNDRRRIFEKARSRQRKHVTFDTTQIVEGSEVRTKSGPIYSIGCIAANLTSQPPMVGILMEHAWSLSEVCRFRLLDPAVYDQDKYDPSTETVDETESREAAVAQQALSSGSRKRAAIDDVFSDGSTKLREEPWPISDVIFIHEEVQNDTAIVKIVDGGYCAVEYQPAAACPTDAYATPASKQLASKGDKEKPQQKMRLIRKDELTVVSHKMRYARSPNSMRVEPLRFVLSGSTSTKRVISAVADSLGIRALVERRGVASIVRVSVCGKTLTSHTLPLHAPSLHAMVEGTHRTPMLMNYGDDAILLIRDGNGGIIPLVRDAAAGFREPTYLQLSASPVTGLAVKSVKDKDRPSWAPKANREAVIFSLQGTNEDTANRRLPSLLHTVMCCDEKAVKALLDALQSEDDITLSHREIVESRADGNRNILHAAVMNAFATKNALEADVENPKEALTTPESRTSADNVRAAFDKKWNDMLRSRSSNRSSTSTSSTSTAAGAIAPSDQSGAGPSTSATDSTAQPSTSIELVIPPEPAASVTIKMEEMDENALKVTPSPVENPRLRQENAIAIVKMLVTHPICMPFLSELLSGRDIHGQTPFMAAVNHRAYSAARFIFKAIESLFVVGENGEFPEHLAPELLPFIFPAGCRPDDSPLFILCYNDTCSFTWTGDEHINQDIFECRTCGLTGSLCCCTECALTCHRNHDCKLKRTSPTAYCDCWEKACCKALVNGNQQAREALLTQLIGKSNLFTMLNGRGEHILLYLARKLARQSSEQWNYRSRPRRIQAPPSARDIPDHDLDPPKFAKIALKYCLRNWTVIRSLAMIGVREMDHSIPMAEEVFHLNAQHGSSHLDKFMLIMLTKCSDDSEPVFHALLRVLTDAHNKARDIGHHLEEVNFVISRFVRSVARLFILAVVISGVAASTAVSGLVPAKESGISSSFLDRPIIRGIASFSGIFGHLRKDTNKDSKLKNMGTFIVRCKVFFEHFAVFTLHEMAQLADASLAPVRTGILRPCVSLAAVLGSAADSIENLEKYINSEPDVTSQLMGKSVVDDERGEDRREERREAKKRRKRSSRRDTDRDEAPSESQGEAGTGTGAGGSSSGAAGGAAAAPPVRIVPDYDESESSDSDSDGDGPSSRRIASQSEAVAANEEARANEEETARREPRDDFDSSDDDEEVESDDSEGDRREDDEDEEEEEDLLDRDEARDEEEEGDEMDYATSEGDVPTSAAGGEENNRGEGEEEGRRERDEERREARRRERRDAAARDGEEDEDGIRIVPYFDGPGRRAAYDFLDRGSSEGSSSPEYSSLSEGDEQARGARRGGRGRRRREPAADAADADAPADAADARRDARAALANVQAEIAAARGAEEAGEGPIAPPQQPVEEALVEMMDIGGGEQDEEEEQEEREGAARTRPEEVAPRRGTAAASGAAAPAAAADGGAAGGAAEAAADEVAETVTFGDFEPPSRARFEAMTRGGIISTRGNSISITRLGSRRNATADASRPEGTSSSSSAVGRAPRRGGMTSESSRRGYIYRRPPLPPWGESSRRATGSRTARTGASATASGGGSGGSSSDEKKTEASAALKEDETPTTHKAGLQLAAAFSFAVRVIGDLLPIVASGSNPALDGPASDAPSTSATTYRDVVQLNKIEDAVRRRAIDHVGTRLEESWRWLALVLDHTEAQIKYINAVSSTEDARKKESKEKKRGQRRKSPHGSPSTTATASGSGAPATSSSSSGGAPLTTSPQSASKVKRETIACLLGVLRAHSGEAGDDTPLIDLETLRAPALVVDAYLGFVESKADAEKLFELSKKKDAVLIDRSGMSPEKKEEEIVGVRRFYQRSNSVSFPGASFTDAHDTLQLSCMQALPIVERPQLLTSTVEKEVIFGPPASTLERTKEEHDKVIRSHGVSHPHNLSLTAAPISSHRLFVEGEEKEEEESMEMEGDHAVQPIQPIVIPAVASAPAIMNEMAEEVEKKKEEKAPKSKRGRKRGRAGDVKQQQQSSSSDDVTMADEDSRQSSSASSSSSSMMAALNPAPAIPDEEPPAGFEKVTYEEILETFKRFREHPLRKLMGRWRFALQLIAKELHADLTEALGGELAGSRLLRELAGFEMKQHELRARMEKYRATATKDLSIEVHRDPATLVRETCFTLNKAFTKRTAMKATERTPRSSGLNTKKDEPLPVLASHKVKVKFVDEPGEGTGVARSYYTALAEALATLTKLPFEVTGHAYGNDEYLYGAPPLPAASPAAPAANAGAGSSSAAGSSSGGGGTARARIALVRGARDTFYVTSSHSPSSSSSGGGGAGTSRRMVTPFDRRIALNFYHPHYTPADMAAAEALNVQPEYLQDLREDSFPRREGEKLPTELADRLFILIRALYPAAAARLTGMFMDLPIPHVLLVLGDSSALKAYLGDAIELLMSVASSSDMALLRGDDEKNELSAASVTSTERDAAPLFFRPSKKAHYSPVPGRLSPARMMAFRNIGRVIGLCLMQCEMFPLRLSRHVLKYILGRPLNWHDFAFYDPQMFESLRKLIVDGCSTPDHRQFFDDLQMTFSIDMPLEATGMPSTTLDLIPGGSEILVTKDNIIEYVYRFVEARLLGSTNGKCLAAMRQGVHDVIPQSMLDNLTAEDLRLVLCGTETVSLSLMQSYTAWTDESHAAPETIAKFKQWFWQVADRLSPAEKQDLIFFWTGAPSLPSTEEGFQPLPTIVIRPTDDGFLPTANTCISRLYLPLYNSKKTLTAKLQLAIKAKNFGFV